MGACNTLSNLSNKVCVSNKSEDLNLGIFDMITGIYDKIWQNIYRLNLNVNLPVENETQI